MAVTFLLITWNVITSDTLMIWISLSMYPTNVCDLSKSLTALIIL